MMKKSILGLSILCMITANSCKMNQTPDHTIRLMTLDPGHFHAALVQKKMYDQVSPEVHVFAPEGDDVKLHLKRIEGFNTRAEDPTSWKETVYTGGDFFEKMIQEKPGNVVMISGNNQKKTEYILESVQNGLNVLADKPMVITPDEFPMLMEAFQVAENNGVLLYDVMTERYEITTILQKELSQIPDVFGALERGTLEDPAITKESVHHFFKYVSGNPLIRPSWFFDTEQQGEGIVDVSTHLVDLVQWECFPGEIIDYENEVEILDAKRWPTIFDPEMFASVTGLDAFPAYLEKDLVDGKLHVFCNGAFTYSIRGIHAKVSVIWNYKAPEGTGDTHYSIMRGSKANLTIRQGEAENFVPTLYIESVLGADIETAAETAVNQSLQEKYPGLSLVPVAEGIWKVDIPDKYRIGHEAHFGQVTDRYLEYLEEGKLPDWEVPNMIAKYYTTTAALTKALQ
jgi:predicted dehydrogenase